MTAKRMTVKEIEQYAGVNHRTVTRWRRRGLLGAPEWVRGNRGQWTQTFAREQVDRALGRDPGQRAFDLGV